MKKIFSLILLSIFCMTIKGQENSHFITDAAYRNKVVQVFDNRMKLIGKPIPGFSDVHATPQEKEALQFLYAYMPLADLTDYPVSFYLENVRCSFKTREEMPWGNKVPELLFRHFVLPIRVNNENLDSSRAVFYKQLKPRIEGMNMYNAILEVNHWCHEHMTYEPSDARTSAPLASMRTATGRCGEESTFAVAALRAVGIPARQVYVPRWAHTDDNHAWVEAWADGQWYFFGACEPQPVLNLGWFNAPASRALLIHTSAFGDYEGPEEVVLRTNNITEINLIDNYATTARVDFHIVDVSGKPVKDARVDFKIYNYAEFYSAVTKYTDADGNTFLTAGKGDMLVWASKDGMYNYAKASFGKDRTVNIVLSRNGQKDLQQTAFPEDSLNIVPPPEHALIPEVTPEMDLANKKRTAREDSIRNAYTSTFLNENEARKISSDAAPYLVKSRGNHATIEAFLARHQDNLPRAIALLKTLSDKDLRDMPLAILEDNFTATSNELCPRVEDEMIIAPFKHYFENAFDKKTTRSFIKDPSKLATWIKEHIRMNPDKKALSIAQTPVGTMKFRMTDPRSRDIFFVDVARSLGIQARKDAVTSKVQYFKNNKWIDVNFDSGTPVIPPAGTLKLDYTPTKILANPMYYSHFTISKIDKGTTQLLNFDEGQVDMGGGTSWENTFKNGVQLDAGTYLLTTGTRLANGSVLAINRIFNIKDGETTELPLDIRQDISKATVIGTFGSESEYLPYDLKTKKVGTSKTILSQTGRGFYVLGILGVGQEPTNHALHDIAKIQETFNQWKRPFVFLFENKSDADKFKAKDFGTLPSNTFFGIDNKGSILNKIVSNLKLNNRSQLPIFIIADTFDRVVFVSQGYTIGLGEQIKNIIDQL
nr:transglutaminase-like domain-containing protein [uncultured Prevotella sp.]